MLVIGRSTPIRLARGTPRGRAGAPDLIHEAEIDRVRPPLRDLDGYPRGRWRLVLGGDARADDGDGVEAGRCTVVADEGTQRKPAADDRADGLITARGLRREDDLAAA